MDKKEVQLRKILIKTKKTDDFKRLARHVIETEIKGDINKIPDLIPTKIFKSHNMLYMFDKYYGFNFYRLIDDLYPNTFMPWELSIRKGMWTEQTIKQFVIWLHDVKFKGNDRAFLTHMTKTYLKQYSTSQLLMQYTITELLEIAYPDTYKGWQLPCVPNHYWTDEHITDYICWFFKERCNSSMKKFERLATQRNLHFIIKDNVRLSPSQIKSYLPTIH